MRPVFTANFQTMEQKYGTDHKVVIYKSKKKALTIIIVGLLLAIGGALFFEYTTQNITGWSFTILSVLCLIYGVGSYFDRKPYIIMTQTGITELSTIREEIEWDAIRHADEFWYRGQYFIRLLLDRNYKPNLIQPTWFYRLDRIYAQEGAKAMFMRMSSYEINSIKLCKFINKMVKADSVKRSKLLDVNPKFW